MPGPSRTAGSDPAAAPPGPDLPPAPGEGRETVVVGMSHRTVPVEILERAGRGEEDLAGLLRERLAGEVPEVLVLVTCNRLEVWAAGGDPDELAHRVGEAAEVPDLFEDPEATYAHRGEAAVRHLFRVAAGLDSQVVGETEILGQVRDALAAGRETDTVGPSLERTVDAAIRAARRAHAETALNRGSTSIASAAVDLAGHVYSDISRNRALLIGAGDTGSLVARHLVDAGVDELIVTSRTPARACSLASRMHADMVPWTDLEDALGRVDIVISCTSAPDRIVDRSTLETVLARRTRTGPYVIIDIAVPRDVDPSIDDLDDVFLHDISDLDAIIEASIERRERVLPRVRTILEEERAALRREVLEARVAPVVRGLVARAREAREEEVERRRGRDDPGDLEALDRSLERAFSRFLYGALARLRSYAGDERGGARRIEAVIDLFDLGPFLANRSEDAPGTDASAPSDEEAP